MKNFLNNLPSSRQNGTRAYVLRKLGIFTKYPSDSRAQELENIVPGISIDHLDRDNFDGDLINKHE